MFHRLIHKNWNDVAFSRRFMDSMLYTGSYQHEFAILKKKLDVWHDKADCLSEILLLQR